MKRPIYEAIWTLGMAVKQSGVEPGPNLAIKMRKPAYDKLIQEIEGMRGPLDPPRLDPKADHVMVATVKVSRAE